ncbi:MAG: glycosyltransferase involved in cell wall biosynthesis [Crocinitomix sp.]|jgi:glycosyltransferase involved in cell wall biosynthesis
MKILVVTEHFSDKVKNGSDLFCNELIHELQKSNDIAILARETDEVFSGDYGISDAIYESPESLQEFLLTIDFEEYDLIYNLGALSFGCCIINYIKERLYEVPLVNHFQLLYAPYTEKSRLSKAHTELFGENQLEVMSIGTVNIFISHDELLSAIKYGAKIPPGKGVVIPNGIRITEGFEHFQNNSKKVHFLLVGRLNDIIKGADIAFRAYERLLKDTDNVFLEVIGDAGQFTSILNSLPTASYSLRKWMPRNELLDVMKQTDILIVPSRYEPFGLVAIEAMEKGKPVIGTDTGGLSEIIQDNYNGLLNPAQNGSLGLYQAMKYLADNPIERIKMGVHARSSVLENYTIERITRLVNAQLKRTRMNVTLFDHYAKLNGHEETYKS